MYFYEGIIGIPASMAEEKVFVNYQVEYEDAVTEDGKTINYITHMLLKVEDEVVALYHEGWVLRPTMIAARIAFYILAMEASELDDIYDRNPEAVATDEAPKMKVIAKVKKDAEDEHKEKQREV